jgi:DNA-binding transcriptional LysR family regulator
MDRLTAMQTFLTVVDTGSFSSAARRLNVGQPAVSKTIAQLEGRLGVKLLVRSTRGLAPTEAGLNFYERARRSVEEADEADLAARGAGAGLSGKLRVCAAVTFARLHVVPKIPEFLAQNPDLEIEIVLDDRNIDLVQEGIDVALRMGPMSDSSLTARKIGTSPRAVMGSAAYFKKSGTPMVPGDLALHQAVVYPNIGATDVWTFRRDGSEVSVTVKSRLRITAAEGVRAAIIAGAGLTIASEWMFEAELADGTVHRALTEWELPPVDLWAIYPGGRVATAKAKAFVTFVEDLLGGAAATSLPAGFETAPTSRVSSSMSTVASRNTKSITERL